jgi:hypothetical protein
MDQANELADEIIEPEVPVADPESDSCEDTEYLPACTTQMPGVRTLKKLQFELAGAMAPANLVKPGRINDVAKLKKFYEMGMTHGELADIFGVTREAVSVKAKKLGLQRNKWTTEEFKAKMETAMLDRMQNLLNSMTSDKVDKASLSQLIMAFGILFDKVRLQRGESTQNVAALNVHKLDPTAIASIKEIIAAQTEQKMSAARNLHMKDGAQ